MIFTDRIITVRKGESKINEPIIVYRGDYELEVRFTIMNSKFKFMSGTNLIESENAAYGQLAILTPYGGNIFSDIAKCNEGTVTFVLTKEMLDQIEEVGLYSFQIRLFDYNKESRVSIPPVEFGIEVREPITSEDHDNSVNNAIVGYSITKIADALNETVPDTFDANGNYNKTYWETGDRITEGKLNKIEDAIDTINDDAAALDKRITSNYNVLNSNKADIEDTNNLQTQINNLVLESGGDSNLEVVQARGSFDTLNDRLNATDNEIDDSRTSSNGTEHYTLRSAINAVEQNIISVPINLYTQGVYEQTYIAGAMWQYTDIDITDILIQGVLYSFTYAYREQFVNSNLGSIIWFNSSNTEIGRQILNAAEGSITPFTVPVNDAITKIVLRLQPVVGDAAPSDGKALVSGIQIYEAADKILNDDIKIDKLELLSDEYYALKDEMFYQHSYNMYDPSQTTSGYYMAGSGTVLENSDYFMTGHMRLLSSKSIYSSVSMRYIVLFNEEGVVTAYHENTSTVADVENAATAVASIKIDYLNSDIMINQGDSLMEYKPYDNSLSLKGFDELELRVDNIEELIENSFTRSSFNLYNPAKVTLGYFVNEYGNLQSNEAYFATDYIPVTGGEGLHCSSQARFITQFDIDQQIIQYDTYATSVTMDDETCFVRITFSTSIYGQDIMINTGSVLLPYEPYDESYTVNGFRELQEDVSSISDCFEKSPNLANPDVFTDGVYVSNAGAILSNSAYYITGVIAVQPGDVIRSNQWSRFISLYDANGSFLRTLYENLAGTTPYTVESDVYGIRYTHRLTDQAENMIYLGDDILPYTPYGQMTFNGNVITGDSNNGSLQANSLCGSDGLNVSSDSLAAGDTMTIDNFPKNLKKGVILTFYGKFDSFESMMIGKGYESYRGDWLNITSTEIQWQHYENSSPAETRATVEHGLTMSDFVMVTMHVDDSSQCHINLATLSGSFSTTFDWVYEYNGVPFVTPSDAMTDVTFSATCQDFRKPLWLFGDSYFGVASNRIIGQLKNLGYFNFLVNGLAGQSSTGAYSELEKCLEFGTPKYIIWCLGMNDSDSYYNSTMLSLKNLCELNNITLILMKIPSVPSRSKEIINGYVEDSGLRYVDAYKAVGADSTGTWYTGYLSGDEVHPNAIGAQAIAMRILVDVPEVLQYGRTSSNDVSGDISGDL